MKSGTPIPEIIGRYEVLEAIATGGMAEVYEVRDRLTLEHHAMKLLMSDEGRRLFDLEYEIMNRLNHPSVVRIYLYGRHKGMPWFSMEYLTAQTASQRARDAGKPGTRSRTDEVVRIGALAARALDHVHQRGIVHRDVKSANVLVLPDGRVKLVDFGVSHLGEPGVPVPPSGNFAGTLGYAAPEQIQAKALDHRADLYALGVLLYRLFTGRMPFKYEKLGDLVRMQLAEESPDPAKHVPELPRPVVRVIRSLLEGDPDKRPRSGSEVADVLDGLAGKTQLPGSALAIHRAKATGRQAERKRIAASTAKLLLIVDPDPIEREALLIEVAAASQQGGVLTESVRIEDAGDRAALQGILLAAREVGEAKALFVIQLASHAPPSVLKLVRSVVQAAMRSGENIRLVVGCAPDDADAFEGAVICELPALTRHETALAIGAMVGRRPPAGALANQLHQATLGWPTAIQEVTATLVQAGEVEAEGNQILWGRYDLDVALPEVLLQAKLRSVAVLGGTEKLILDALAFVEGATSEALTSNLPGGKAIEAAIAGLVEARRLTRDAEGVLRHMDPDLAAVLRARPLGSSRASLERVFAKRPALLACTPFRARALLHTDSADQAIADATELCRGWLADGDWDAVADLLHEVVAATRTREVDPALAEVLLLYAESASATRSTDAQDALIAVGRVRKSTQDVELLVRCDLVEATVHLAIGHYANHSKHVLQASRRLSELQTPELIAQVHLARGQSELWSGNLRAAVRAFGDGEQPEILAGRARCAVERGRLDDGERMARMAVDAPGISPHTYATALRVWADALRHQGRFSEALQELRQASARLRTHPDQRPFLSVMLGIGWCEADLHRLGLAQECVDELAASLRRGELLHYRIERDLLDAWIAVLSGRPLNADYALQSAERRARTAGLRTLADQAQTMLIETQYAARIPPSLDLDRWLESRRIAFLADGLIWVYADAAMTYIRHHPSRPNPDDVLKPLIEKVADETAFRMMVEALLMRSERALEDGRVNDALIASRDAAAMLARVMKGLEDSERGAYRVHPWNRRIAAALTQAQRASGAPTRRR